jgi:hypothetical protein
MNASAGEHPGGTPKESVFYCVKQDCDQYHLEIVDPRPRREIIRDLNAGTHPPVRFPDLFLARRAAVSKERNGGGSSNASPSGQDGS